MKGFIGGVKEPKVLTTALIPAEKGHDRLFISYHLRCLEPSRLAIASLRSYDMEDTEFDVLVIGTSLTESIVAAYALATHVLPELELTLNFDSTAHSPKQASRSFT